MYANFLHAFLATILVVIPLTVEAGSCPGALVNERTKVYQKLGRSAKCYSSVSKAENDDLLKDSSLCINGKFASVGRIEFSGEGPSYSTTFKAGVAHPKLITSYTDIADASFSFELIQRNNGHRWVHFLGSGPFSNEETYLNETTPGVEYYLAIHPSSKFDRDLGQRVYGSWSITLITNPDEM